MVKKKKYYYSKNEDYLYITTGTISKIIELNKEYDYLDDNNYTNTRFKTTFSLFNPRIEDKRFQTCISWDRQVINVGDLVTIKGRYLENGFLIKSLTIVRKAQVNADIQDTT